MKKVINISLLCLLTLCLSVIATAQQGIIQMSNGITVRVNTKITPSGSSGGLGNIYSSNSGNIIHRILTDKVNKIYFGYDLLIEKQEGTGKFKVSIKPLSKTPDAILGKTRMSVSNRDMERSGSAGSNSGGVSVGRSGNASRIYNPDFTDYTAKSLPNYPEDIIVEEGDTITLHLLENASTNSKISDLIKINGKSGGFNFYTWDDKSTDDKPAKDFTIDDVIIRMERPQIYINEKEYKTNTTLAGNISWVYIKGKGRFIFSIKPQSGYDFQQIGSIRNNKLSFEFNGEKYRFVSKSPIVGFGGNWNLWVMHDPNYQPDSKMSEENPFTFGAAGSIDYTFQKR